jgi:predicted metal-dependent HD superfamily phosphohydrolase
MSTQEKWAATWRGLGAAPPEGIYEELMARYAEPQRRYHTLRHIEECFAALETVRSEAERPAEVELALWFHDAIYNPRRKDNEQRSAEWARSVLAGAGVAHDVGERVAALIMATRHAAVPVGADACVLVDVDLAILGAPPARFDEYERDVREEYAWVPDFVFRRERRKVLEHMLARPRLFNTARMHELHEQRARANLARSVRRLRLTPTRRLRLAVGTIAVAGGLAGALLVAPTYFALALGGAVWLFYEVARPH